MSHTAIVAEHVGIIEGPLEAKAVVIGASRQPDAATKDEGFGRYLRIRLVLGLKRDHCGVLEDVLSTLKR